MRESEAVLRGRLLSHQGAGDWSAERGRGEARVRPGAAERAVKLS